MAGFGIESKSFDQLPEAKRVYNADRSRAASWWVGRSRSDRYDDDTVYEIGEWEVATKKKVGAYSRVHRIDNRSGDERGKPVSGVRYGDDGKLFVVFEDGSHEPAKTERPGITPREGPKRDLSGLQGLP